MDAKAAGLLTAGIGVMLLLWWRGLPRAGRETVFDRLAQGHV